MAFLAQIQKDMGILLAKFLRTPSNPMACELNSIQYPMACELNIEFYILSNGVEIDFVIRQNLRREVHVVCCH